MNIKLSATLAALVAAFGAPAQAITLHSTHTQGGTIVTDYASSGLVSFDVDFANRGPAVLTYLLDAADFGMPLSFNAVLRNFTGSGIDGYTVQLGKGGFATIGSVTRQFGGDASASAVGGLARVSFATPEFLDVELGNALASTPGASDWQLNGLQAGDLLTVTVTAVPEPGTLAMWLAGILSMGFVTTRPRG